MKRENIMNAYTNQLAYYNKAALGKFLLTILALNLRKETRMRRFLTQVCTAH